ncbi:hypothetical protein KY284_001232 [Solanum tuberosum]|nr:hypothetical protein KY284_001232 [Solanum tuberosum]
MGSTLPAANQRPSHRECISGDLVTVATNELILSKAIVINFYETLRLEMKDDVGITIPTHRWIGPEITRGKFMMDWRKV